MPLAGLLRWLLACLLVLQPARAQSPLVFVHEVTSTTLLKCIPFGTAVLGQITVDWGDGSALETNPTFPACASFSRGPSHTYSVAGNYTVSVDRSVPGNSTFLTQFGPEALSTLSIIHMISFGDLGLTSLKSALSSMPKLLTVPASIPSSVTSLNALFSGTNINSPNISSWDVSSVTDMNHLFTGNQIFNQPLASWNTSGLTTMRSTFQGARAFNQPIDSWVVSRVTDMTLTFGSTRNFNQSLSSWDTSAVTSMSSMFSVADSFDQPIGMWNVGKVKDLSGMFFSSGNFQQDISGWNTSSATSMARMFSIAIFNRPIGTWDVSKVTDMQSMFNQNYNFNQPLDSWNTNSLREMSNIFSFATSFNRPVNTWNTSLVTSMNAVFSRAYKFNQPLDNWKLSSVADISNILSGAEYFDQPLGTWDVSRVTNMDAAFFSAFNFRGVGLANWNVSSASTMIRTFESTSLSEPIGNWDVSKVTSMDFLFSNSSFNQPIGNWNVTSVTSMDRMFSYSSAFSQDISSWVMPKISSLNNFFEGAVAFNSPLSSWNVSLITSMSRMFSFATSFNQPLESWNVSSVTSMRDMFYGASAFNQSLNSWNVSKVIDMFAMFRNTMFDQPLPSWDVRNVFDIDSMFSGTSYNRPLATWCLPLVSAKPQAFASSLEPHYEPLWGCNPRQPLAFIYGLQPVRAPLSSTPNVGQAPVGVTCVLPPLVFVQPNVAVCTASGWVYVFVSCEYFGTCGGNTNAPTTGSATIPFGSSIVLQGNTTVSGFTLFVPVRGSVAGTITLEDCLSISGNVIVDVLASNPPQRGDRVAILTTERPECFNQQLNTTVSVQGTGSTSCPRLTASLQQDQQSKSLFILFDTDSSASGCSNAPGGAASAGSNITAPVIGGAVGGVVAISIAVAATYFYLRHRRYARERDAVRQKLAGKSAEMKPMNAH